MPCLVPGSIRSATLVCLLSLALPLAAHAQRARVEQHRYHHLYHALWELRDARQYLKETKGDFSGHKEAGLVAIGDAIKQLEYILKDAVVRKLPAPSRGDLRDEYKRYANHPHLYQALIELRAARNQLFEDKYNFGGHKEAALRDLTQAIVQIDQMLHPHYHLYHALWELRDAHTELKESKRAWGEHKEKALVAISGATRQIEVILKNVPERERIEPTRGDLAYVYSAYANHPHLHHCLPELRAAERQLKESRFEYGGHREAAIRDIHAAIVQIELLLERAPK